MGILLSVLVYSTIVSCHTLGKLSSQVILCVQLLLLHVGINRWLWLRVSWLLIFFKSNHVSYWMEIGQEFLNPGLNPGITNEGMFISSWLLSLWKCGEKLKYTEIHHSTWMSLLCSCMQWNNRVQLTLFIAPTRLTKEREKDRGVSWAQRGENVF